MIGDSSEPGKAASSSSAAVGAISTEFNLQVMKEKAEKMLKPFLEAVEKSAQPMKKGYNDFEKHLLDYVNPLKNGVREDYKGPVNLVIMSIHTPTITPKMTSYFLHCCTVSAVAFAFKLLTGLTGYAPKLVIAGTAFVLFDPFCEKVSNFKKYHPKAFALLWGSSWVGMCMGHEFLFSTSLRIANNIFKGEVAFGASFLLASAAMSYFMMMPVERLQGYIQAMSADQNKSPRDVPEAATSEGGAVSTTPVVNRAVSYTTPVHSPVMKPAVPSTARRVRSAVGAASDSPAQVPGLSSSLLPPQQPYTPVLCFIEGYLVDKILQYIGAPTKQGCCEQQRI